jgi:hypothetical protein
VALVRANSKPPLEADIINLSKFRKRCVKKKIAVQFWTEPKLKWKRTAYRAGRFFHFLWVNASRQTGSPSEILLVMLKS